VDKSLVLAETQHGEAHYRLLETVRQYARDRLAEAGEAADVRTRHRDWYLALAEQAEEGLPGHDQRYWLRRLDMEHDNLRVALEWTLDAKDAEIARRLAGSLSYFWRTRDYFSEGAMWWDRILSHDGDVSPSVQAKSLRIAAEMLGLHGQFARAAAYAADALDFDRRLGDKRGIGISLNLLGLTAASQGDLERATLLFSEGLAACREAGEDWWTANALTQLGEMARRRGNHGAAQTFYEESLALLRVMGDQRAIAAVLGNLGFTEIAEGDPGKATLFFQESLNMQREVGSKKGIAEGLLGFAGAALAEGNAARATRLLGAAEVLLGAIDVHFDHADQINLERWMKAARTALGDVAFTAHRAEGQAMTLEQAIEYALAERPTDRLDAHPDE